MRHGSNLVLNLLSQHTINSTSNPQSTRESYWYQYWYQVLRNLVPMLRRSTYSCKFLTKVKRKNDCLYNTVSGQICRSKDQTGSQAGVPERQMAGPNPLKGPINILELM